MRAAIHGTLALTACCAAPAPAADPPFLSVNFSADELVSIDPSTGVVTPIGALGVNVEVGLTMTRCAGQIYLTDAGFGPLDPSLYTINETTGAATLVAPLSLPGSTIEYAEARTADASGLLLVLDDEAGNSARSRRITRLDESTGGLTALGTIPTSVQGDMDLDAAAFDFATGDLVGVDGVTTESRNLYRRVVPATGALTELGEFTGAELDGFVNGLHLEGARLFAVTSGGGSTGSLVEVAYDGTSVTLTSVTALVSSSGGAFNGLVRATGACAADIDNDGDADPDDIQAFVDAFIAGSAAADIDNDGDTDPDDIQAFVDAFVAGC